MNPLQGLQEYGQSVWLDYIRRDLMENGELRRLIADDGLRGMTSNPAIFEKAIADSTLYDAAFTSMPDHCAETTARYEHVAIRDIQHAADTLRPVYDSTQRRDGYVSLEVSPYLAHDTAATLAEARRLWAAVARENVMIKVPGTPEGIPAVEQLISEGLNINVTLLFAQEVYERVAEAFISGIEKRAAAGKDVRHVASVASFFISRIDTLVDTQLSARLKNATGSDRDRLQSLHRQGGHRQRQADLRTLRQDLQRPTLGEAAAPGRADTARAVGEHQHEEPELSRRAVRRGAHRTRHRQHNPARDLRRVPRSWTPAAEPD